MEAWSPLMKGRVINIPEVIGIAAKYGKTAAQLVLRWHLQRGVAVIPKSSRQDRIIENADIFDFRITQEDMAAIDALNTGIRIGAHPDHFDF